MMIIHYEVYVLEPRGWMLHARFPRAEREDSLIEAKELEQAGLAVRVIRETYYSETNNFDEADIYITPSARGERDREISKTQAARPRSPLPPRRVGKPAAKPPPPAPPRRRPRKTKSSDSFIGSTTARLLAASALGLAAAMLAVKATPETIVLLWSWGFVIPIQPTSYDHLLLTIFVLTFLMVSVPAALYLLPQQPKRRRPGAAAPIRAVAQGESEAAMRARALKEAIAHLSDAAPLSDLDEAADADSPPAPAPNATRPPALDAEDPPSARPSAESIAQARATATKFLNGAVSTFRASGIAMDNYSRFALHLYIAGAVEALCSARRLGGTERRDLTAAALEPLGTPGTVAERLHDRLDDYLMEPRYLQVVQAGRGAMLDFMGGGEGSVHGDLKTVIQDWNRPTERQTSVVTVMFTDMVGSTDLTQRVGDNAAQEIVRRHNTIARGAIVRNGGREIKHTGDGIMASFGSAAGAVEAAIGIQREVADHNVRQPGHPLHLRIGLNAGEPIQEENDLFGTTVQLAARVCAATQIDQILCTGVVRDLAVGKGAAFSPAGTQALKGFRDPVALYEVLWR